MAKFIDKKEQVYDLKLTNYGHYLLSIGKFKAVYYTFLDDNVIYDKQYAMARRPHATYTQYDDDPGNLGGKTLVLTDASTTSHTFRFRNSTTTHNATGEADAVDSSSTTIQVFGLEDTHHIVQQVAKAINAANTKGLIGITAGSASFIWEDDPPTTISASAHLPLGLTMELTGTQGNGKTITGTVFTGGTLAANTTFGGGFDPRLEPQNEVHNRIKNETQYLESLVLFRDIESGSAEQDIQTEREVVNEEGETETVEASYFKGDVTPTMMVPKADVFKFNGIIGDAYLDGETQAAPAWKVVALQGLISSSTSQDVKNNEKIPQINMDLNYTLTATPVQFEFNPDTIRDTIDETRAFVDDYVISLKSDDVVVYMEEVNTDILTENFDIEVFKVLTGSGPDVYDTLERKFFKKVSNQIINGVMKTERPAPESLWIGGWRNMFLDQTLAPDSVEYYFDILTDAQADKNIACRGASYFNKKSYYVDIDFDCDQQLDEEAIYYDIYGSAMEPEICQD